MLTGFTLFFVVFRLWVHDCVFRAKQSLGAP
jgi:hypothetical protein